MLSSSIDPSPTTIASHHPDYRKSCLRDLSSEQTLSQKFDLKKVIFDEITIREYPLILGDNPSVSAGKSSEVKLKVKNDSLNNKRKEVIT